MLPTTEEQALQKLAGLGPAATRRAADTRVFHFGGFTVSGDGSWGEYALHVPCAWRIDGPDGVLTGRADLWEPWRCQPCQLRISL